MDFIAFILSNLTIIFFSALQSVNHVYWTLTLCSLLSRHTLLSQSCLPRGWASYQALHEQAAHSRCSRRKQVATNKKYSGLTNGEKPDFLFKLMTYKEDFRQIDRRIDRSIDRHAWQNWAVFKFYYLPNSSGMDLWNDLHHSCRYCWHNL